MRYPVNHLSSATDFRREINMRNFIACSFESGRDVFDRSDMEVPLQLNSIDSWLQYRCQTVGKNVADSDLNLRFHFVLSCGAASKQLLRPCSSIPESRSRSSRPSRATTQASPA